MPKKKTEPADRIALGQRIRHMRREAGFDTPSQLVHAIKNSGKKLSRQFLYALEAGKCGASVTTLRIIAEACGGNLEVLFGRELVKSIEPTERKNHEKLLQIQLLSPATYSALVILIDCAWLKATTNVKATLSENREGKRQD